MPFRNNTWGDQLVCGDLLVEFVIGILVKQHQIVQLVPGLSLGPLLLLGLSTASPFFLLGVLCGGFRVLLGILFGSHVSCRSESSNISLVYFFQTTFRDYFNAHLLKRFDNIFSHAIAFPALCEDFVSVLHPDCPEEYTEVVQESKNLANEFTEEIAKTGVKLVENYCQLMLNQERKEINIKEAAKLYHEKEQEIKRKEQEKANPKNKGKKD